MHRSLYVTIPSTGRPGNVPLMQGKIDGPVLWAVQAGEGGEYRYAGADDVLEVDGGLSAQRNACLEQAFARGKTCVMLDDDLARLQISPDLQSRHDISVAEAARYMALQVGLHRLKLGGTQAGDNLFFRTQHFETTGHVMNFLVVRPSTPRFDPQFRYREDIDFSLQHLHTYGGVLRCNEVLGRFTFRSNRGGCQSYGEDRERGEAEAGALLGAKWGDIYTDRRWRRFYGGPTSKAKT